MTFKLPKWVKLLLLFLLLVVGARYIMNFSNPEYVITSNFNDGVIFFKQKKYRNAVDMWETTLEQISKKKPNSVIHSEVLEGLCYSYLELDDYKRAQQRCNEALTMTNKLFGKNSKESKDILKTVRFYHDKGKGVQKKQ